MEGYCNLKIGYSICYSNCLLEWPILYSGAHDLEHSETGGCQSWQPNIVTAREFSDSMCKILIMNPNFRLNNGSPAVEIREVKCFCDIKLVMLISPERIELSLMPKFRQIHCNLKGMVEAHVSILCKGSTKHRKGVLHIRYEFCHHLSGVRAPGPVRTCIW